MEISDDEGSFELEDDVGVVPKNEDVNYDLPPHNMSSAGEVRTFSCYSEPNFGNFSNVCVN